MKRLLACGVSVLALAVAAGAVRAQEIETVESTGVRASVQQRLTIKQNSDQILDAIVAEDIGKLPDSTVVESLQHVTGIAIIRNNVEPAVVLIRGLPDVQTLVNGRSIFTATGRAISLPDIPSELLSRVDVHKSSSATDIEGGIAGLINVHFRRPFDFKGTEVAGQVQLTNESMAAHVDPTVSFLVSDRWTTGIGEVGLLLDMSYKNIHNRSDQMTNQTPQWSNIVGPVPGAGTSPLPVCTIGPPVAGNQTTPPSICPVENAFVNFGQNIGQSTGVPAGYGAQTPTITLYERMGSIERASMNLAGQWRPNANIEVFAEAFYTRLRQKQPVNVNVLLQYVCPDPAKDSVYTGTNVIATSVSSCYNLTSMQDRRNKEDTLQLASGADWYVTDRFKLSTEVDVTLSKTLTKAYIPDDTYNIPTDGLQLVNNYQGTMARFITAVGNKQLDPSGMYLNQFFDQRTLSKGSEWDWRGDASYEFEKGSYISSIELGLRVSDRSAHNSGSAGNALNCVSNPNPGLFYNNFIIGANASQVCVGPNGYVTNGSGGIGGSTPQAAAANYTKIGGYALTKLPTGAVTYTHGNWFGGQFGVSGWANVDPDWLWDNVSTMRTLFGYGNVTGGDYITNGPPDSPANLFIVSEVAVASYLKVNYSFDVFGLPVDGNFGFRFIDTTLKEQANNSLVAGNPAVLTYTPTVASHETSDFLPSLNMRVTLDDNMFMRFAVSKTATRPTFAQLNPSQSFSGGGTTLPGTSASGNPNLSAEKSLNLDLDGEYYWGKGNHVSVAGFHRYVQGYIQNRAQGTITVNGLLYTYTRPENYQNAYIDGVEMAYSQFLDFLPGFWSGFGWDVNGTYIAGPFNNITKWHFNGAAIYEQGPYSFRASYTWSSSYQVNPSVPGGTQPTIQWAMPRANLDLSFNYRFDDHFTLSIDATNLNDGLYRAYDGKAPTGPLYFNTDYQRFDKTYSLGLRYRM